MKFECPHGLEIGMVQDFGIICYYHKDGTSCDLLNVFNSTIDEMCLSIASSNKYDDSFDTKVAIISSYAVRRTFYEFISRIKDEEKMKRAFEKVVSYNLHEMYTDELIDAFGKAASDNIESVIGKPFIYSKSFNANQAPKFKILNLKQGKVMVQMKEVSEEIKKQLKEVARKQQIAIERQAMEINKEFSKFKWE